MESVDAAEATAWMADTGTFWTGYDPRGWPASTWVLHAIHERIIPLGEPDNAAEEQSRTPRILWRDLAVRYNRTWPQTHPPGPLWLPGEITMPLWGPTEGEMDPETVRTVFGVVAEQVSWQTTCLFYWSAVNTNDWPSDQGLAYEGLLSEAPALWAFDPDLPYRGSPSNIWARGRTWMITTEADNWGTRISGPLALIQALEADRDLECVRCAD